MSSCKTTMSYHIKVISAPLSGVIWKLSSLSWKLWKIAKIDKIPQHSQFSMKWCVTNNKSFIYKCWNVYFSISNHRLKFVTNRLWHGIIYNADAYLLVKVIHESSVIKKLIRMSNLSTTCNNACVCLRVHL